jgi:hypothetical protein
MLHPEVPSANQHELIALQGVGAVGAVGAVGDLAVGLSGEFVKHKSI